MESNKCMANPALHHLSVFQLKKSKKKYRGIIQGNSREKTRQVRENSSQQLEHKQVPKRDETIYPDGKHSLLACHTRCKCSVETTRNSVIVKLGIKVIKLVKSQISLEVNLSGSKCRLTFVKGKFFLRTSFFLYFILLHKIPVLTISSVPQGRYPCLSSWPESRLTLKIKHSYGEQAREYRIS